MIIDLNGIEQEWLNEIERELLWEIRHFND
jgi:hypothetical protein